MVHELQDPAYRVGRCGLLAVALLALVAMPAVAQVQLSGQWELVTGQSARPIMSLNPLGYGGTLALEDDRLVATGTFGDADSGRVPATRTYRIDGAPSAYDVQGVSGNPPTTYTSEAEWIGSALLVTTVVSREGTNSWHTMFTVSVAGDGRLEIVVTTPNLNTPDVWPYRTTTVSRFVYRRSA